jgi:N-acetylglucosaminyldiphosphoundecaprenol N-acetyl-beta-D-mannosaminyltransferase
MDLERIEIDGLPITACAMSDVERILGEAVAGATGPLRLATVNLDFLRLASRDPGLRDILRQSHHNFADGWPLLQMASLHGRPLPERVTGSDLAPRICEWAGRRGWKLALVGGSARTRDVLAELIPARYGDVLAGHWVPDYRGTELRDPDLAREIAATGAEVVLVALGCPRQERWIWLNLDATGARAAMGVGGSLDFMAGVQQRAPRAVRALGLEWLYRALSQPRRLGPRYALDFVYYLMLLARTAAAARRRHDDRWS